MLNGSHIGRTYRQYFAFAGRTGRLEYFAFVAYVAGTTGLLLMLEAYETQALFGQFTFSGFFLFSHLFPLIGAFVRRVRSTGLALPRSLFLIWAGLFLGFPLAAYFGSATLYGLVSVVLGQFLAFDILRQPVAAGVEAGDEHDTASADADPVISDLIWHQLPPSASRGISDVYRVQY